MVLNLGPDLNWSRNVAVHSHMFRPCPLCVGLGKEKRAQRLTFWARRLPGWMGVFHAKGRGSKSSCPPSKVSFPWASRKGSWDVPGILPGCPGPLGVFTKLVHKKFVRIFRSRLETPWGCSQSLCKKSLCAFVVPYWRRAEHGFGEHGFKHWTQWGPHRVPVSSSRPIICWPKRTHRVLRRTHRVCCRTQWVVSHRNNYKRIKKIPWFWIFSLLNYESGSQRNSLGFKSSGKCGLLLWLVYAQHDHYESKCERKSGGIYLPFLCESESEIKSPDFHL